jgi:hypothetical protein
MMREAGLLEIVDKGGPMMLVALLWLVLSLIVAVLFFTGRLKKPPGVLLVFPVGFGLLAITYFVLQGYNYFKDFEAVGPPDPAVYCSNGLRVTRASLLICAAGGLTFLNAVIGFWSARK